MRKIQDLFDKALLFHQNNKLEEAKISYEEILKINPKHSNTLSLYGLIFGDELHDFKDTAALIENVDLVISVDTSIAHLSGTLGKKTFVLLPFLVDWRWMLDRDDSPWYPSVKLFRQNASSDWYKVLNELVENIVF